MYYEVENTHESLEATVFYNIDLKVDHIVFSVADMRGMYGEKVSRYPYIVPAVDSTKKDMEKMSPYWASQGEQTEEITDKHLVTLGKHQQQFLGSFKPKPNETGMLTLKYPQLIGNLLPHSQQYKILSPNRGTTQLLKKEQN